MSTYCTKADMLARFDPRALVQLTDRPADNTVPPATTITDAILNQAIADAGTIIDPYLAVVTTLPVTNTSALAALTPYACDITLYQLYRDAVPELVSKKFDAAITWLRDVRDNKMRLFPDGATATEGEGAGLVETNEAPRKFTARNLRDAL